MTETAARISPCRRFDFAASRQPYTGIQLAIFAVCDTKNERDLFDKRSLSHNLPIYTSVK